VRRRSQSNAAFPHEIGRWYTVTASSEDQVRSKSCVERSSETRIIPGIARRDFFSWCNRMIRLLVVFVAGTLVGGTAIWLSFSENVGVPNAPTVEANSLSPEHVHAEELASLRAELDEWKRRASSAQREVTPVSSEADRRVPTAVESSSAEPQQTPLSRDAVRWRVSAIEKFVSLTEDQRQRLKAKFERESIASPGESRDIESLEDILGQENSRFYREQVKAAFKRVQDEELDREVVWLTRQLSLSSEQEQAVHNLFGRVEQRIKEEESEEGQPGSPEERVRAMIHENKRRSELRNDELRSILLPEQYETYMKTQAESSAADVELFHQ